MVPSLFEPLKFYCDKHLLVNVATYPNSFIHIMQMHFLGNQNVFFEDSYDVC